MNIKDDFILSQIQEGYLVGGSVRDFVLLEDLVVLFRELLGCQ